LTYQWQESTDGGANYSDVADGGDYTGATMDALTVANPDNAKDTYQYQVIVTGTCGADTSAVAVLLMSDAPSVDTDPTDVTVCEGDDGLFTAVVSGSGLTYQWQRSTDGGSSFNDISDNAFYSGTTTDSMTVIAPTTSFDTYQYRLIIDGTCAPSDTSATAVLTIETAPSISTHPIDVSSIANSTVTFSVVATGTALTYQWEESTDGGANFNALSDGGVYSGTTSDNLTLTNVTNGMSNNQYRVIVSGNCSPADTSSNATLTVGAGLFVKVFLSGAYDAITNHNMDDNLRSLGMIPASEPYSSMTDFTHIGGGGETAPIAVLTTDAADESIVDWVFVEYRDKADSTNVLATQSGLLQRDGDVVDVDGVSPLMIPVASDDYYIAVRHRNHLGVMTAAPISVTNSATVDFTSPATATYGTHAQREIEVGVMALWAGDGNRDGFVIFQGANNDLSNVFFDVLEDANNANFEVNYISQNYQVSDYNLDGASIFQGVNNDLDVVFFTVMAYPENDIPVIIYIVSEQLP